jgi:hypothetical protein
MASIINSSFYYGIVFGQFLTIIVVYGAAALFDYLEAKFK